MNRNAKAAHESYSFKMIHHWVINQKSADLANCGTKAADVLEKFLAGKHNVNPLNILVHLQLIRLHCYRLAEFKVFWDPQFWE